MRVTYGKLSDRIERILSMSNEDLGPSFEINFAREYIHAYLKYGSPDVFGGFESAWKTNENWWRGHLKDILEEVKKMEKAGEGYYVILLPKSP